MVPTSMSEFDFHVKSYIHDYLQQKMRTWKKLDYYTGQFPI